MVAPDPSEVLGAYEWAKHGGQIKITNHPGGRYSIIYVSREDHKFRSWRQCLQWIVSQLPPNLGKESQSGSKRPFFEALVEEPHAEKRRKTSDQNPPTKTAPMASNTKEQGRELRSPRVSSRTRKTPCGN